MFIYIYIYLIYQFSLRSQFIFGRIALVQAKVTNSSNIDEIFKTNSFSSNKRKLPLY